MIINYLKVAVRSLLRGKLYTLISVAGLALGIACCFIIFLYVQDELSFDKFHTYGDRLYRVILNEEDSETGEVVRNVSCSILLLPELKANFPEIEGAVRIAEQQSTVKKGDLQFNERVSLVDPDFFRMFSFKLAAGNPNRVLEDPASAVISRELAEKYFGGENPLGKTLAIRLEQGFQDFIVSGIIENAPLNSSIQYSILLSTEHFDKLFPERHRTSWNIQILPVIILLREGTDIQALDAKLDRFAHKYFYEEKRGFERSYDLQPFTDMHLNPEFEGLSVPSSDPVYFFILGAIALGVLLLACINFTSLSIGRSISRAEEVGMRKVLGANRRQLMFQFWSEALLLSISAVILGLILASMILPTFNTLAEKQLSIDLLSNWSIIPILVALALATAIISGAYPALLLSGLNPIGIFKADLKLGGKNRLIQGLVVLQFALTVFLLLITMLFMEQMKYIANYDLGYDKESVVTFATDAQGEEAKRFLERFRHELSGKGEITDVTGFTYPFGSSWLHVGYFKGRNGMSILIGEDITGPGYGDNIYGVDGYYYVNWVDDRFIPTLGLKLIEGRNFSEGYPADEANSVIINRKAAEQFGYDDPLGQMLPGGLRDKRIIGVIEDFHFYPLHRKMEPLVLHMNEHNFMSSVQFIAVRIRGNDIPGTIAILEDAWTKVSQGGQFDYRFLDERVAEQYRAEIRWRKIVEYSTLMSFIIASMGLFGLSSLAVAKRTKEIGIRKVLGATVSGIVWLVSKEFLILIAAANILAWFPVYFIASNWLNNFAFKVGLSGWFWIFPAGGAAALTVALLTIGYQSLKAAIANPVTSIRYE